MLKGHALPHIERLHHAWLITGPKGIGKATFARVFAWQLLTDEREFSEDARYKRMLSGAHGDFLSLAKLEDKSEINIEQVREVGSFLSLKPSEAKRRVVLIDGAEDLNPNAANALLKLLEEPPPGVVLLLVSHRPGLLLPTVRSRCRVLRLLPLGREDFIGIVQQENNELTLAEAEALYLLAPGAPGEALGIGAAGLTLYAALVKLFAAYPYFSARDVLVAAQGLTASSHAQWTLLTRLLLRLIERAVADEQGEVVANEQVALSAMRGHTGAAEWAARHAALSKEFSLASRQHFDYKTVFITSLESFAA